MAEYNYKDKITMKFSVNQLERIIIALLNNGYNKKFASNVKRLFNLFNPNLYKTDYEKELRVYIVKSICDIILEKNIETKEAILSFIDPDGKYYNDAMALLGNICEEELPETELELLDKSISNQLRYSSIMERADGLSDKLLNLKAENYDDLENFMGGLENDFESMNREIKSARESIENSKKDLSLSSSSFINTLGNIISKERNPSSKIKTGIQYLNTMLGGGFTPGRLTVIFGVAKGWKSGFMLNMASMAKRYNTFKTHNPSLKPVIVYLTMENTTEETIERLWNHCFGDSDEIKNHDKIEAANKFEQAGLFTPNDPNSAELLIWYRPNRSINTADLNAMLEDLKTQGKECCFLVVDYLKRIRPTETNKDLRLELANATNELKTIAMEQDIPILTGMQLNRDAFRVLEEATTFDEKLRASDKLGASNVGESIDVVQNCDLSVIVNQMFKRQFNDDGDLEFVDHYLYVKLIATRCKQPAITSFKHRFMDDNGMRLIEDINMAHPVSTSTDTEFIKERAAQNGQKTKGPRSIA